MEPLMIDSGLSVNMARLCIEASSRAYDETPTIATERAHCLVLPGITAPALGRTSPTIVAFRGSQTIRDWLTDLECLRRRPTCFWTEDGEEVHHGFADAIEEIATKLLSWWGRPVPPSPMYLTGHSLGGAMAILAARLLASNGFPVAGVYTFGQPRVGNRAFAAAYDDLPTRNSTSPDPLLGGDGAARTRLRDVTFRFVNQEDIVPRVPFWHWGFRHSGQEVFQSSLGLVRVNPRLALVGISDVIGTWLDWRRGTIGQLTDHEIKNYAEWINAASN